MSWKLRAAVSALLLAPQAAFSLGLGDIRLGSALSEPLSAEIDLVAPTSEELNSLSAQLASRELFQRYGIDRPAYLDSVTFRVGRGRDGRNVLLVNSAAPISEPFVTFLVEVNWPRGRLLREYTVLLDPPVFAPKEAAAPAMPVAPPRAAAPAPAPVAAPAAAPRPAPAAPAASVPAGSDSTYRVQRGDTLYGVASRFSGGGRSDTNRMMIAMFRANPEAFGGNINVLRSGAILRIPGPESVADVGAGEAASEIGRQTAAWRAGTASEEPARLRLVTPSEAGTAAPAAPSGSADPQARIAELGREIEESRRLLELRSAELAQLQRQVEEQAAAQAAAAAPAAEPEAEVPAAPEAAAPEAATPPAPVAETAPAPAAEAPAPAAAPAAPETSFVDTLTDNWQYVLGGAALLLGGVFAVGYLRRRREEDFDESIRSFEPPAAAPVPSETRRLRALKMPAAGGMVVGTTTEDQELEDFRTATIPPSGRKAEDHGVSFDDTLSSEESADLDKGDPLAEADFHMAYGLYDQAADIVKQGLEKEPGRRDYEIKLLEIYFVSGDKENFLASARRFDASRDDGDGADWDRVLIMGHQLAPDDPLFEGGAPRGGVDLNLEGGDSRVDLELLSPPGEEGVDLDLGQALQAADSEADTGESKALDIDLDIDDTGLIRTAEMERLRDQTAEMPTVEMPRAHGQGDSPTMEATRLQPAPGTEATVEMAMDDLGIDIGDVDAVSEDDVTQLLPAADDLSGLADAAGEMDFDLTEAASGEPPADEGAETQILDIGGAIEESIESTGAAGRISLDELPQMSELEPVTMSEVGTKLDLAQAYVDMGDPDGARSILEEVLKEGSASQKQEARRLLDSLPGA